MKIELISINEIKPYENNPRNNDEAVEYVAKSIKNYGFKVPIIIDKNNVIVAGHTRYKASKKLKLDKVPIIRADDLNEEQIKAFRIADNKVSEVSSWDFEKLETELETLELDDYGFDSLIIDWDSIEEISGENYDEPEHTYYKCPFCQFKGKALYFKKKKVKDDQ